MVLKTRDFGDIEINEEDIIEFKAAIFGFEEYRRFAFLCDDEVSEHFAWLQSVEEQELCFILADPTLVLPDYQPALTADIQRTLGEGDIMSWLIVVVKEDFRRSTVNLKSPILVNPATRTGAQVILEADYPIQFPLLSQQEGA